MTHTLTPEQIKAVCLCKERELKRAFPHLPRRFMRELRRKNRASFVSAAPSSTKAAAVSPKQAVQIDVERNRWQSEIQSLRARYSDACRQIIALRKDRDLILGVKDQLRNAPTIMIKTPPKSRGHEATACSIISDWHVEEEVRPRDVNGRNEYNLRVAEESAQRYFQNLVKVINGHRNTVTIRTLVLFVLGDLITNYLHDDNVEAAQLPPVEALLFAQRLVTGGIDYILRETDLQIQIVCDTGNHGRITHKPRTYNRHGTNLEYIIAAHLSDKYDGNHYVSVSVPQGLHTFTTIYDRVIRSHHGDAINYQGGIGGLQIPCAKAIKEWNVDRHADLDVMGHWHGQQMHQQYIVNGSLIGPTSYGLYRKLASREPGQVFWLEDSKYSKRHGPLQFTTIAVR